MQHARRSQRPTCTPRPAMTSSAGLRNICLVSLRKPLAPVRRPLLQPFTGHTAPMPAITAMASRFPSRPATALATAGAPLSAAGLARGCAVSVCDAAAPGFARVLAPVRGSASAARSMPPGGRLTAPSLIPSECCWSTSSPCLQPRAHKPVMVLHDRIISHAETQQ